LFVVFFEKGKTTKNHPKDQEPYPGGHRRTWGTPNAKKRGFPRMDISPPYSALGRDENRKTASGEEKPEPVYIRLITGMFRKPFPDQPSGILSAPQKIHREKYTTGLKAAVAKSHQSSPAVRLR